MSYPPIITISGMPGSGKTSVSKHLALLLGYESKSMGGMRGEIAIQRGITLDELNKIGETESWTDRQVDDYQAELGRTHSRLIVEGRTGFHFIPHSYKIFLNVDPIIGAQRILDEQREGQNRSDERIFTDLEDAVHSLHNRIESDKKRYNQFYGIVDYTAQSHYNLYLDTSDLTPEQVIQELLSQMEQWKLSETQNHSNHVHSLEKEADSMDSTEE